mgnify:CR=1 FL=1
MSYGIAQELDQLQGLSIQELMRRHSVDPKLVYAIALQEKTKMEEAKTRQGAMAQQPPQPADLVGQMEGGLARLQQERMQAPPQMQPPQGQQMAMGQPRPQGAPQQGPSQGIAGIAAPNMAKMAGGGIVAFADGGATTDPMEAQRAADARRYMAAQAILSNPQATAQAKANAKAEIESIKAQAGMDEYSNIVRKVDTLRTGSGGMAGGGIIGYAGLNGSVVGRAMPSTRGRNNPFNIRDTGQNWDGQVNPGGEFTHFDSEYSAVRAADKLIKNYGELKGIDTIRGIVSKYAPETENDTEGYINKVAELTGIPSNQPIDLSDPTTRGQVLSAIGDAESGYKITPGEITAMLEAGKPKRMSNVSVDEALYFDENGSPISEEEYNAKIANQEAIVHTDAQGNSYTESDLREMYRQKNAPPPEELSNENRFNNRIDQVNEGTGDILFGPNGLGARVDEIAASDRRSGQKIGAALEQVGEAGIQTLGRGAGYVGSLLEYLTRTGADIAGGAASEGKLAEGIDATGRGANALGSEVAGRVRGAADELANPERMGRAKAELASVVAQLSEFSGDIPAGVRAELESQKAQLEAQLAELTSQPSMKDRFNSFVTDTFGKEPLTPEQEAAGMAAQREYRANRGRDSGGIGSLPTPIEQLQQAATKTPDWQQRRTNPTVSEGGIGSVALERGSKMGALTDILKLLGRGAGASKGYEFSKIADETAKIRSAQADRDARTEERDMIIASQQQLARQKMDAELTSQAMEDMQSDPAYRSAVTALEEDSTTGFGPFKHVDEEKFAAGMLLLRQNYLAAKVQELRSYFSGVSGQQGVNATPATARYTVVPTAP